MQGLWSAHRRTKLNLNSASSPGATTPLEEAPVQPTLADAQEENLASTSTSPAVEVVSPPDTRPSSVNGKRKLRSSRTAGDESTKRTKFTSTSTNPNTAISKDHTPPTARLSDLGGVEACVEKMLELVAMPLCHPEVYLHTGVQPPRGVLLHGPPGCGKTLLANAMAGVCFCSYWFTYRIADRERYRN